MTNLIETLKQGVNLCYSYYYTPEELYNEEYLRSALEDAEYQGISPFDSRSIKDKAYGVYFGMQRLHIIAMYDGDYVQIFIMPSERIGFFLNYIYRFCDKMPMADQLWGYCDYCSKEEWNELKSFIDDHYSVI